MRGLDKVFDYVVPESLRGHVRLGTLVRVPLHGRRVGGWVVAVDVEAPPGVTLKPIARVTGWGPAPDTIELARWAAWRWAGPVSAFVSMASPPGAVAGLPALPRPAHAAGERQLDALALEALGHECCVVRKPPAADPFGIALAASAKGDALVLAPSVDAARQLGARLRHAGVDVALPPRDWARAAAGAVTVVGARAAAWAPVPDLAAVVVLDEHDEVWQQEGAPTWHARDIAVERARRAGVPCVLVSPVPSLEALAAGALLTLPRTEERAGWPVLEIVDRTRDDPLRRSLITDTMVRHGRSGARMVVVHNTPGKARLLACATCGQVTRCERCQAAVGLDADDRLRCRRCGTERPVVCQSCGATRLKARRLGVSRLRDELEVIVGAPVVGVTGATAGAPLPEARVYVGTEAVLHQVPAADVVVFADFDAELTAPRYRAAEQAIGLLARAARLVGGRIGGGRLVVQTGMPRHEVLDAVLHADPGRLATVELQRRRALRFPPVVALAELAGAGAATYAAALAGRVEIEVLGPADDRWLVRAANHATLADALAATPRPSGRLRVAVDPPRV